jgi:methylenetetrahydrofolate dehydrogenase (NADP+)/methenyltetrahydrofolate cyclohydrolase
MTTRIIDGAAIAAALTTRVADEAAQLARRHAIVPGLAVVLVGDDPASALYVRGKVRRIADAGMRSFDHRLPAGITEADLLAVLAELNVDDRVHGILVQLPLPPHIDTMRVMAALDPDKDVDGLHPLNAGRLASGAATLVPCTPRGCVILARSVRGSLAGKEAVVVGRSVLVGKPLAQVLLAQDATVTIAHSKTEHLDRVCARADLLFVAIGRPEYVRGNWVKPGATVIDAGIGWVPAPDGKARMAGDVAFDEARAVAGAITPVPGGVGPMTVACLLLNTLTAASQYAGLPAPDRDVIETVLADVRMR